MNAIIDALSGIKVGETPDGKSYVITPGTWKSGENSKRVDEAHHHKTIPVFAGGAPIERIGKGLVFGGHPIRPGSGLVVAHSPEATQTGHAQTQTLVQEQTRSTTHHFGV
jgi:hypothetical protein